MLGLIAAMAVVTSTSCFIGKQDGGKNWLRQNYRADRKLSRRYRCVSRRRVVSKSEGIGSIDGAHDEDAGYLRQLDSARQGSTCRVCGCRFAIPHVT